MPHFSSPLDQASLFYRHYKPDESAHRPRDVPTSDVTLVFLHGFPLSSRLWEHLLVPLCETHRIPVVAPDRRGFGKSEWNTASTSKTISWDVFVADLVGLLESLDLKRLVFVAHSMAAPESVLAFLSSSHLQERTAGFIWLAPSMPYPVQSDEHPLSPPMQYWEQILDGLRLLGPDFLPLAVPGLFAVKAGNEVSQRQLDFYSNLILEADRMALDKTVAVVMQNTEEAVKKLALVKNKPPILLVHGDADENTPLEASSRVLKEMLPWSELKVYEKGGHLMSTTHAQQFLADILAFVEPLAGRQGGSMK